jgi:transposase
LPSPPQGACTHEGTTPTAAGPIPALDLGKYKSVACAYDPAGAEPCFQTIPTSRAELARLLDRRRPAVVVIEACTLAGWVQDLCRECGFACEVADAAGEARKFKHARRKTDRDDALRLAPLEALGQLPAVTTPPQPTREWRALIAYRQGVVGRRVAARNRIRSILRGQGLPAPRGRRAWTATGLPGIAGHARPLAECGADALWRGLLHPALAELRQARDLLAQTEATLDEIARASAAVRTLETVPGVGPRTAEAAAACLHDPHRFRSGRQASAYAGLVPRQYRSGTTVRRRTRLSKAGNARLREARYLPALTSIRFNPLLKALYARLTDAGKAKMAAFGACMRKLLMIAYGVLKNRAPFDPSWAVKRPSRQHTIWFGPALEFPPGCKPAALDNPTTRGPPQAVNRTGTTPCCKNRNRSPISRRSRRLFASRGRSRIASRDEKRSDRRKVWVSFR